MLERRENDLVEHLADFAAQNDLLINKKVLPLVIRNAGYCPCKSRKVENICPCSECLSEVSERGRCRCGLFHYRF